MALPTHMGDTREPHPVHFLFQTRNRALIITVPNEPSTYGEPLRTERGPRRTSPAPENITPAPATAPPIPTNTAQPPSHTRQAFRR
jgi:hypothetical protein